MEARTHTKKRAIEFFMRDSEYEHCTKKCGQLSLDEAKDFLLDGGCFLLMRYLVQQQFIGSFEMLSMLVTGMSENLIITLSFSVYRTATIFFLFQRRNVSFHIPRQQKIQSSRQPTSVHRLQSASRSLASLLRAGHVHIGVSRIGPLGTAHLAKLFVHAAHQSRAKRGRSAGGVPRRHRRARLAMAAGRQFDGTLC